MKVDTGTKCVNLLYIQTKLYLRIFVPEKAYKVLEHSNKSLKHSIFKKDKRSIWKEIEKILDIFLHQWMKVSQEK